ncbi:MAG: flagellar protein [Thermoanaerobacteraceae bacterium]|nr:flagellar protein [Thermoanaerobacteraceae bacterium]
MTGKINLYQPLTLQVQPGKQVQQVKDKQPAKGTAFQDVFQEVLESQSIKFSKHAKQRLSSRNISLGPQQVAKLNEAVEKASKKGAKESLILMNDVAFIVSVRNRTVVTAVDGQSLKENVFTNIDSAVIL